MKSLSEFLSLDKIARWIYHKVVMPSMFVERLKMFIDSYKSSLPLAVVIPCYNEEKRLEREGFISYLEDHPDIHFIFVNDGSADGTLKVLNAIQMRRPNQVSVLDLTINSGKAEAVRQGMLCATKMQYEYVAYWDADLATPLDAIDEFMRIAKKLPQMEVIYGVRKAMLGHQIERKVFRRIVSKVCSTLARVAVNLSVSDTQCGAKVFKNTDALRKALITPFIAGWLFDIELFSRLSQNMTEHRTKFFEYPLLEWNEIPGSNVDAKAIIRSSVIMFRLIGNSRLRMPFNPAR